MKSFEEIYEECSADLDVNQAKMKFIIEAKKNNNDVKLVDVRKFLGYYNEDPKKDAAESTKFRSTVLFPVRNYITGLILKTKGLEEDPASIWSRENAEKFSEIRSKVNEFLPKLTRKSKKSSFIDLSNIINIDIEDDSEDDLDDMYNE